MKNALFLTTALFLSITLAAQKPIQEGRYAMSEGTHNGFLLNFENVEAKEVQDIWDDYVKDFKAKSKKVKGTDEYMSDDAQIEDVSENTVDIYTLAVEKGEGASLFVWFNLGGAYLSSKEHPNRYPAAAQMLAQFTNEVAAENLSELLDEQEDVLKDLEKTLDDQVKEQEKEAGDIKDYEEKIREAEKKIEELKALQKETEKQLKEQTQKVEETKQEIKRLKKM